MRLHGWTRRGTAALAASIGLAMLAPAAASAQVFSYTGGEQPYEVPVGARTLSVSAIGGPGGAGDSGAAGGFGSRVQTTLPVTGGQVIYVDVGAIGPNASGATGGTTTLIGSYTSGGANGGSVSGLSHYAGGAGGGASELRTCSYNTLFCFLSSPLVVAAGGGGGGGGSGAGTGGAGDGAGGAGLTGAQAGPGLQTGGGAKGPGGNNGDLILGGAGAAGSSSGPPFYDGAGGGGGGGLFGGGGGGAAPGFVGTNGGGGGGGGSSMASPAATGTTITTDATGIPQITLTAIPMTPSCAGNALNTLPGGSAVPVVLPCTTPMGVPITYAVTSAPGHGTLGQVDQTTGTVTYTPAAGYTGTDTFAYTATNSGGTSSPATATITIPAKPSTGQTPPGQNPPGKTPTGGHCLVPKLKGGSLATAKRRLAAAGCSLGRVTKPKTRKHRPPPKNLVVVSQGAAPGTRLGPGSKVAVTLGAAATRPKHR